MSLHKNARIIIMGDLNDDPVSNSVARVLSASGDKSKALSNGQLYNPWNKLYSRGIGTLSHNDKWNLFDQIILSPAWLVTNTGHWQYYQARVFEGYPHRSYSGNKWINGYSDHFPTIIYLIKDAPLQKED
jgi:hypothetical protein